MVLQRLLFSFLLSAFCLSLSAQSDSVLVSGDKFQVSGDTDSRKQSWYRNQNLTLVGVPMIAGSLALRPMKEGFRQNNSEADSRTQLLHNFSTSLDNYTQYAPVALSTVLNMAGYEGHSNRLRYLGTAAGSYAIMAAMVNGLKYTVQEMRPDGSTKNSWPSGHTATVFVGATILHHEYGLTRSPWYSVGGYTLATATATMRVLNNRHWVSDVFAGAGIGILSTEVAYMLADVIFKDKGINRQYRQDNADLLEHPSFIGMSAGGGFGTQTISVGDESFKFGVATAVGAEGAWYFNKYVGVGGRLRLKSAALQENKDCHLTDFSYMAGAYGRYPINNRMAVGTKLLVGRNHINDIVNGDVVLSPGRSTQVGTGLNFTFAYKNLYQWTAFCDYDFSRKGLTVGKPGKVRSTKKNFHSVVLGASMSIGF